MSAHPWLVPPLADGRRTSRDWAVDVGCVLAAAIVAVFTVAGDLMAGAGAWTAVDVAGAALACAALWFRRRWPVPVTAGILAVSAFAPAAAGAAGVGMYTVAVYRRFPVAAAVCASAVPLAALRHALRPVTGLPWSVWLLVNALAALTVLAWGMFARARRGLMLELAERARRAEAAQRERAEAVRRAERGRIAREMHDALAHRLSLLSLQAGALEYAAPEAAEAAGVIRASAHQALEDLRDVIVVLREDGPVPHAGLSELPALAAETRAAGTPVEFDDRVGDAEGLPERVGRAVHHIVREALTNARKHAPGEPVTVLLDGREGEGITVAVRQPLPAPGASPSVIPGTGTGLIGLAERAALAGGRLSHGREGGDFAVRAWLPWPS